MQTTYTKQGMKITHPTGVVQILSVEDLTRIKNSRERRKEEINADITHIDTHIKAVNKKLTE